MYDGDLAKEILFQADLKSRLHRHTGDAFFFMVLCELSNVCLHVLVDGQ
jgi:hypothetical protein